MSSDEEGAAAASVGGYGSRAGSVRGDESSARRKRKKRKKHKRSRRERGGGAAGDDDAGGGENGVDAESVAGTEFSTASGGSSKLGSWMWTQESRDRMARRDARKREIRKRQAAEQAEDFVDVDDPEAIPGSLATIQIEMSAKDGTKGATGDAAGDDADTLAEDAVSDTDEVMPKAAKRRFLIYAAIGLVSIMIIIAYLALNYDSSTSSDDAVIGDDRIGGGSDADTDADANGTAAAP
jgi:hypothetical protein